MIRLVRRFALVLLVSLGTPLTVTAQTVLPAAPIAFSANGRDVALDYDALAALPQVEQKITFQTKKGPETAVYKGPLETDGHKLKDGFRIVAQGDKRGARAIHNVAKIELK
jgi:hypothetical protein